MEKFIRHKRYSGFLRNNFIVELKQKCALNYKYLKV